MPEQASALSYAVRFRVLAKYFGYLGLVIGGLTLVPLAVSLGCGQYRTALRYLSLVLPLSAVGVGFWRFSRPARIQVNEAFVLTATAYLAVSLVMVYPFMATGMDIVDAFFEAVSGITTTGLTTLADIENKPLDFLFARAWLQWCGGLGIVVISLVLFMRPGSVAKDFAISEGFQDDLLGGMKFYARRMVQVYGLLTGGAFLVFLLLGSGVRDGVLYALTSVSTGGFSPHASSLAGTSSRPMQFAVILTCVAGGMPLVAYYRLASRRSLSRDQKLQGAGLLVCGILLTAFLYAAFWISEPRKASDLLLDAPLLAFSAQSTAGFSTTSAADLTDGSKLGLVLGMFVGGGVGSTAGGIKIWRFLVMLSLMRLMIYRTSLSRHAVLVERLAGRRLDKTEIQAAALTILLFVGVIFVSWLSFVVLGYDAVDALFDVVSATGTVGLSAGITAGSLPVGLKLLLCADMLLGRLEIVAWLVCLSPNTWIGRRV